MAASTTSPQAIAPLSDALEAALARPTAHLSTPGHKRSPRLAADPALRRDLPLLCGIEDQRLSRDLLGQAQRLAASAWGADWTRFSVQGSTHPNLALAMTVTRPGASVVVGRTSHKSVLAGLVLSGAEPVWVVPEVSVATGAALGVAAADVAAALDRRPDATAVWVADPSYVGVCSETEALAALAHARGIPLVVDQAWGAHFGFHPALPPSALAQGADAVVVSVHKTLTAFSQGAMIHALDRGRIDLRRLAGALESLHTTSPSGVILASLDAARALVERDGEALLDDALELADRLRSGLAGIDGVRSVDAGIHAAGWRTDPLKVVIDVTGTGVSGLEIERRLRQRGVQLLMADAAQLVPLLTLADEPAVVRRLLDELAGAIATARRDAPRPRARRAASRAWRIEPEVVVAPREAFFAARERVPAGQAAGRVAAETIAPYPPGIPAVAPGERLSADLVADLRAEARAGTRITGPSDPSLETLVVLAE